MLPQPLKILYIGDGRPGHEKQSRALIEAFKQKTPVESRYFSVPEGRFFAFLSRIQAFLSDIFPALGSFFIRSWGFKYKDFQPDLIIATGSHTHGAIFILGQHYKAKTLICMTPDKWIRKRIDLVLSPFHDGLKADGKTLITLGPPCSSGPDIKKDRDLGLILIGGIDKKSHFWSNKLLEESIKKVLLNSEKTYWEAGSSPRTPYESEEILRRFERKRENFRFLPFSETEAGWLEAAYAGSSEVWVTADSISMVYEALSSGCRLGVLPVKWKKKNNKFQKSLDYLYKKGLIIYPGESFDKEEKPPLNEALYAVEEAISLWWKKN